MNQLFSKICDSLFKRNSIIQDPQNILIIRSGAIGDVLMSTPLIHTLKESYTDTKVSYLVGEWSKPALKNNPHLDKIIPFDDEVIYKKKLFKTLKLIYQLRKRKFDLCFLLDKSWHWGALAWLAGIPHRIGFDRFGESFVHTQTIPFDGSKYELEYYLDLLKKLDPHIPIKYNELEFYLSEKDKQFANDFLKQYKIKSKKRVVLFPGGANNPGHQMHVKRWPEKNFLELAKKLEKKGIKVIWVGNKDDIPVIEKATKGISKVINAASQNLTLSQSTAIIEKSHCIVTPDSALMHLASAVKTPTIALFGPTHPKRFAPKNAKIFFKTQGCHNCYSIFTYGTLKPCETHECMENIKVNEVFKAILQCLKEK